MSGASLSTSRPVTDDRAAQGGDWTLRLFEASPLPPVATGLALVLGYALVALACRELADALGVWGRTPMVPFVWELVNGVLIAFPLTASAHAYRAARRDLLELRPCVELDDAAYARELEAALAPPQLWRASASWLSVAVMALVVLFDPGIWGGGERPGVAEAALYWGFFHNLLAAWCFGRMLALEAALTRGFVRVAARLHVDLLAPELVAPLARKGQRSVMLWLLLSSSISLFWLGGDPSLINGAALGLIFTVAATAFLWPLARARERIGAAKRRELERVHRELEREREALLSGSAQAPGRVADLVAWRSLVAGVHEWAVSAPILLRSLLFVLLGLGSWLGGALVERILEATLPR